MSNDLNPQPIVPPAHTHGQIPKGAIPENQVLSRGKTYMTDMTRKELSSVGWQDGDPLPAGLGAKLAEIQKEQMAEQAAIRLEDTEEGKNWKPVKTDFVQISDLSPEKQQEVANYLKDYKTQLLQQVEEEKNNADIEAQIPASIQGEDRETLRRQLAENSVDVKKRWDAENESVAIDDRPAVDRNQTAPPAPPPQKTPAAATTPIDTGESLSAGTPAGPDFCPRCNWPVHSPYDIVPTDMDKQKFMIAILGQGRFEKQYELLGGNMLITLRSLDTKETVMLQEQLSAMLRTGVIENNTDYIAQMLEQRLAMSVARIEVNGSLFYSTPAVTEWAEAHPQPTEDARVHATPIIRMVEYFYENGATQETVRRVMHQQHRNFQQLVEGLEVMTADSDFWTGIELLA